MNKDCENCGNSLCICESAATEMMMPSLTLRQYYAGLAMQGLLANPEFKSWDVDHYASIAIKTAEQLIAELEKQESEDEI